MTTPAVSAATRGRALVVPILLGVTAAAVLARFAFVNEVNSDYRVFLSPWYDALAAGGGFRAIGREIGNYNPPYLYLLAAATYLPIPKIAAIKLLSIVFDVVLAGFAALIVRRRFGVWTSVLAYTVVLFAPTVLLNSGYWGQCDSIYAAFVLGSLYFLLRRQDWWAAVFFGLALSFKLQAIFFLPALLIVMIVNRRRPWPLLAVPATFVAMLVPAALAGRSWFSLALVYPGQVSDGGGGRPTADGLGALTRNAPTMYQWVGGSTGWLVFGLAVGAALVLAITLLGWRHRPLDEPQIVLLATAIVLAVPFVLPQMHERYFYLADVLTIVSAFYVRRFWPVAVVVSTCSLLAYAPFLWGTAPIDLPLVAFAEFLAVVATLGFLVAATTDRRWIRPVNPSTARPATRLPSPA